MEEKNCSCSCGCCEEEKDTCSCHDEHGCTCHDDDGCSCGCGCDHDSDGVENRELLRLTVGAVLFVLCLILEHAIPLPSLLCLVLYLIPYLLIGRETLWISAKRIVRGAVFDENFLMSIASIGAFCVGQYEEGAAGLTLCDAMDCSTPGLPAHHQLPELSQSYVH